MSSKPCFLDDGKINVFHHIFLKIGPVEHQIIWSNFHDVLIKWTRRSNYLRQKIAVRLHPTKNALPSKVSRTISYLFKTYNRFYKIIHNQNCTDSWFEKNNIKHRSTRLKVKLSYTYFCSRHVKIGLIWVYYYYNY